MLTRVEIEEKEETLLAPYAMKSRRSKGRLHPEKEHDYRPCYQRDRDRIIHTTAFRRLEYKTQVFVNHEGDNYRTRLTHTIEVAQIARSIARALRLNEDLTETLALAHDIGHGPFGHAGEDALKEMMKDHGGFDHNLQGLRVVDFLEERYPGFKGLNLTWEVREGINKHTTPFDHPDRNVALDPEKSPLLETQVVDVADEIAYDNHDLDDGVSSGLLKEEDLLKISLWEKARREVLKEFPTLSEYLLTRQILKSLINAQITSLITASEESLKTHGIRSLEDVRHSSERLVVFDPLMAEERKPLKKFLMKNLYHHYRVVRMSDKARRVVRQLFEVYMANPEQLPPYFLNRVTQEGPHRVICDYVAGMTDRFALDEYKRFFDPHERV
ncbi:MAG: deoxyguanosinetriphosphate triphosphohydrolase [Candidatus Omnitrophica bacterium]|nr:deoxyguanosinetriphosphate triphosphohydrolase [Candidatus Omnitrophota bacterium]